MPARSLTLPIEPEPSANAFLSDIRPSTLNTEAMPARSLTLPIVSESSANALLSDLRPTTLNITTLAHLNALLDELLVSIVSSARSINFTHLQTRGATAVLRGDSQPGEHASLGALGRAAVGEAEVEIRSWYESHPTAIKGSSGFPPDGKGRGLSAEREKAEREKADRQCQFPVLAAVELMRLKVGTLATLAPELKTEQEKRIVADWEKRVLSDWKDAGGDTAEETIAPAGLWLTAVLEHVCEHILAKLSQVVARDSAASSASVQDLYTALCEDDSVYPFFQRMQIKGELESLARSAARPKRQHKQRSSQKATAGGAAQSRASSLESTHGSQPSVASPPSVDTHSRQHSASSSTTRPSSEQFYKSVIGVAKAVPSVGAHKRTSSVFTSTTTRVAEEPSEHTNSKRASTAATDRAGDDFDAILRSNETVRVSLTPSRFSTFERTSPQANGRRYSDHLSAPVSSSESSLLSSSTQASTVDSGRMSSRPVAGRSWSSGNKLQPRDGTIEERDEEDFGTTVMELLKSEPRVVHTGERSVSATMVGTQSPHLRSAGRSTTETTRSRSPSAETPSLDDHRSSPRADAVASPRLEVPDGPNGTTSRNAASDDAHEPKIGTSATYRASRHRSEHLESQRHIRELADFLSNTGPPVANNHVHEESTTSQTSSTSRMSFKGFMSRMSSSKRNKDPELLGFKSKAEKKSSLIATPALNTRTRSNGSGGSSGNAPLRSQRSASSVATSASTAHPHMNSTPSLSGPQTEAAGETNPKAREVVRKPSLVRKWAAQVTAVEPIRAGSRRRTTTPVVISSPLPTVSLDDDPVERRSTRSTKVAESSPQLPASVLGIVPDPASPTTTANRDSFYTSVDDDFSGDTHNGSGTPEAALATLTASSRSGKSSSIISRDPERERSIYDRPVSSSFSARSSPRLSVGLLRHERVHELSEVASVRSSRVNGNAHQSSSAASTNARSVTESSPSVGTPSVSGSPRTTTSVLPARTANSINDSPRSEQRPLSRAESSSGYTSTTTPDGHIPVADLLPLRHLLDNATSARECQLLLDAILSQLGVPRAGEIAGPEERVAAWLLAGRDGPCTHIKEKKVRRKKLSPEIAMKTLPALPGSPLAERDGQDGEKLVGLGIEGAKGLRV